MIFQDVLEELRDSTKDVAHAQTGFWVAATLRERISAGQIPPGTKLSEELLGDALRVSRNTLREAFVALSAENIVTRLPNRGVFVAHPTPEDIREIYHVRRYLEPAGILWAPKSSMADIDEIVERGLTAYSTESIEGMAAANQDFHFAIIARAGSDRLNAFMARVLAEMRLVFYSMEATPNFHAPYMEENARIASLMAEDRLQCAAEAMISYLNRAESQLLSAVSKLRI